MSWKSLLSYTKTDITWKKNMTVEHWIVGATGCGYAIVGLLRWSKGDVDNGLVWTGYALAQIGLWRLIK